MLQAQDIYNSFSRYKRDVADVESTDFLEWVQFVVNFIHDKVKRVDAKRFLQSESYNVVLPPQSFTLPTDFENLNQTDCGLFIYNMRKRQVVTFDENGDIDVTFTDSGGTSAYESNIKVQGGSSMGFTGDGAATLLLSFGTALDLTDFDDSGAYSPSNDHLSIWVYVGNTVPTSATIEFSTSSNGSDVGVNQLSYTYSSLIEGWNRIKVLKSDFTLTGSAVWSSLGYLRLIYTGGDSTTNLYWDKLDLIQNEVNGKSETKDKLGITGYGSRNDGYYLEGGNIVFTGTQQITDNYYVMKYLPKPPVIDDLTDYITVDGTSATQPLVEDRHLEYLVKAVDVLYTQWDNDPSSEGIADQRFVRALGGILDGFNRQPQISVIRNNFSDY